MSYYNTTNENQVPMFAHKNRKQDDIVLNIAIKLDKNFTASEIWKNYPIDNVPLTSIRRSINTLVYKSQVLDFVTDNEGDLVKSKGIYGRNEFQYKVL